MSALADRFEEILLRDGPALRRVAASYEADPQRAEDLFQDICLAVWRALPGFRGEASVRTFVFRIAHNRGLAALARRRPPAAELEEVAELADHRPDPEAMAGERQRQARLFAAVRRLPVGQRQVLTLSLEGLSHREIADVAGTSENNVAVRLNRARRALRQALEAAARLASEGSAERRPASREWEIPAAGGGSE